MASGGTLSTDQGFRTLGEGNPFVEHGRAVDAGTQWELFGVWAGLEESCFLFFTAGACFLSGFAEHTVSAVTPQAHGQTAAWS